MAVDSVEMVRKSMGAPYRQRSTEGAPQVVGIVCELATTSPTQNAAASFLYRPKIESVLPFDSRRSSGGA
jgi:hypothetical protein